MRGPQYFFAYAREDSDLVLKLAKELRSAGVHLWLDQLDIKGGQHWDRAIEEALHACEGMIVVLSPDAVASDNVMDEVSYALDEKKLVVPVLYRPCKFPFRLRRVHYIDFTRGFEDGCIDLLRALDQTSQPMSASPIESLRARSPEPPPKMGLISPPRQPEVSPRRPPRDAFDFRPLAMHLIFGFGLLYFDNRLLRGWVYPCAFVYCAFVAGVCFGDLSGFQSFCDTSFSGFSLSMGLVLYALGFVDIAFAAHRKAQGRKNKVLPFS